MARFFRSFGVCAPAAALSLKVAQAAFLERALWVELRAEAEGVWWEGVRRRFSPRLCGWLTEVSLRATSPAAATQTRVMRRWRQCRRRA